MLSFSVALCLTSLLLYTKLHNNVFWRTNINFICCRSILPYCISSLPLFYFITSQHFHHCVCVLNFSALIRNNFLCLHRTTIDLLLYFFYSSCFLLSSAYISHFLFSWNQQSTPLLIPLRLVITFIHIEMGWCIFSGEESIITLFKQFFFIYIFLPPSFVKPLLMQKEILGSFFSSSSFSFSLSLPFLLKRVEILRLKKPEKIIIVGKKKEAQSRWGKSHCFKMIKRSFLSHSLSFCVCMCVFPFRKLNFMRASFYLWNKSWSVN